MADITSKTGTMPRPVTLPSAPSSDETKTASTCAVELPELVELLFFAYRDFTAEPDAVLEQYGFGRAHHRVLHFVDRAPGLRVADLLDILKITKQSLARVLKQLVERGFVEIRAGHADRRERLLYATAKGRALAKQLAEMQNSRVGTALEAAGPAAAPTLRACLLGLVGESDRAAVEAFIAGAGTKAPQEDEQG